MTVTYAQMSNRRRARRSSDANGETVLLTARRIARIANCGSLSKDAAVALGLGWPIEHGWKDRLRGRRVGRVVFDRLVDAARQRRSRKHKPKELPRFARMMMEATA